MNRLLATLRCDVLIQFRNGFYLISVLLLIITLALASLIPDSYAPNLAQLVPALAVFGLMMTTFYFVAALVLFEKGEGTLAGRSVTPLRRGEYLLSKVITLTGLAIAEVLIITVLVLGTPLRWLPLLAGMTLMGALYTLTGFAVTTRYDSLNGFILPSGLFVAFLMLPLLDLFDIWSPLAFYLHPFYPFIIIIQAAFIPVATTTLLISILGGLCWCGLGFWWAHRQLHRFVLRTL